MSAAGPEVDEYVAPRSAVYQQENTKFNAVNNPQYSKQYTQHWV